MSASVKLALGELANTSYLTVKNLVPGAGSFTVSTESFKGSITVPVGVTLVAYVRNAKVVSKVVTAAASDAGKDLLSLAQDLAAYLQSLQPVPRILVACRRSWLGCLLGCRRWRPLRVVGSPRSRSRGSSMACSWFWDRLTRSHPVRSRARS